MPLLLVVASLSLLTCFATSAHLSAGEAPSTAAPTTSKTLVPSDERSLLASETKLYVAQITEQRNLLRQENDTLRSQQGLLLIYGALLSLLSGWLIVRTLRSASPNDKKDEIGTNPFPASGGTTVTVRKNATITIRNSSTQEAEVVDTVQTRLAYSRTETASHTKPATRPVERRESTQTPSAIKKPTVVAPELDPATPVTPIPARPSKTPAVVKRAPTTVRIEQQSDRLEPVDVVVKPGTEKLLKVSGSGISR